MHHAATFFLLAALFALTAGCSPPQTNWYNQRYSQSEIQWRFDEDNSTCLDRSKNAFQQENASSDEFHRFYSPAEAVRMYKDNVQGGGRPEKSMTIYERCMHDRGWTTEPPAK